jgi:ssDNA-binding Zn-finger/Zn-ribbon topoisomerase 1
MRTYVSLTEEELEMINWISDGIQEGWITHHPNLDPHSQLPTARIGYSGERITVGTYYLEKLLERLLARAQENVVEAGVPHFNGDGVVPPECPKCGARMQLKVPKDGDKWSAFWGCPKFPRCKGNQSVYFVYVLVDPITDQPFYVGMTKNPERRFSAHLASGNYHPEDEDRASRKARYISSLSLRGEQPEFQVLEYATDKQTASDREDYWIMKLIRDGHDLTNKVG